MGTEDDGDWSEADFRSDHEVKRLITKVAAYSEQAKAIFVVLIDPDGNMLDELRISLEALSCKDKVEIVCMEVDEGFDEDEDEDEDEGLFKYLHGGQFDS